MSWEVWAALVAPRRRLATSWDVLGASRVHLGASWKRFGSQRPLTQTGGAIIFETLPLQKLLGTTLNCKASPKLPHLSLILGIIWASFLGSEMLLGDFWLLSTFCESFWSTFESHGPWDSRPVAPASYMRVHTSIETCVLLEL